MKAEALTASTIKLPTARIFIEIPDGRRAPATGFILRENSSGETIIIIKAPKKLATKLR